MAKKIKKIKGDSYLKTLTCESHYWGDSWLYWDDLYDAIKYFERYLRRRGVGIYGKEKYGSYVDEYLMLWSGGLYDLVYGYSMYKKQLKHCRTVRDYAGCFVANLVDPWLEKFNRWIGLTTVVQRIQKRIYNNGMQETCARYPHIIGELTIYLYNYELIRPCRKGDVDGAKIHEKFWKRL